MLPVPVPCQGSVSDSEVAQGEPQAFLPAVTVVTACPVGPECHWRWRPQAEPFCVSTGAASESGCQPEVETLCATGSPGLPVSGPAPAAQNLKLSDLLFATNSGSCQWTHWQATTALSQLEP